MLTNRVLFQKKGADMEKNFSDAEQERLAIQMIKLKERQAEAQRRRRAKLKEQGMTTLTLTVPANRVEGIKEIVKEYLELDPRIPAVTFATINKEKKTLQFANERKTWIPVK
jgi:hypothetical protein